VFLVPCEGVRFPVVTWRTPGSWSQREDSGFPKYLYDSGFTETQGGLRFHGVKRRSSGSRSHPKDPGFQGSPGGVRVSGVTRNSRLLVTWNSVFLESHRGLGFPELPEYSGFPESSAGNGVPGVTRIAGSRRHPQDSGLPESPGVIRVPLVTRRNPGS